LTDKHELAFSLKTDQDWTFTTEHHTGVYVIQEYTSKSKLHVTALSTYHSV